MFTAQSRSTPLSSEIQHVQIIRRRKISQICRYNSCCKVKAVIQSGNDNKTVKDANFVEKSREESNGSLLSSGKGRDVKAVVTLRKKMKEKITDKIEDQWESLMNGIGRGILIQLISQDIDPGFISNLYFVLLFTLLIWEFSSLLFVFTIV